MALQKIQTMLRQAKDRHWLLLVHLIETHLSVAAVMVRRRAR